MKGASTVLVTIDYPKWVRLSDVAQNLQHTTIYGHKVLCSFLTSVSKEHDIPHPGHDITCRDNPHRCKELSAAIAEGDYKRFYGLTLVVDGVLHFADQDVVRFRWSGSTMIIVNNVVTYPEPDYVYELTPWEDRT